MNGRNITFPIYNEDGTSFNNLVMHKATIDMQVMSLGYKITGDVYYKSNKLHTTMNEYIVYEDVKYFLVNPPTIVREGLASDNSENRGMTKYSFEFYHPMYMLGNIPMTDVATSSDETKYKSQDKVFSWVGRPDDYIRKINKNLEGTPFVVVKSDRFPQDIDDVISDVISFNNNYVSDALKTAYDTWGVPYVVDTLDEGEYYYQDGNTQIDYYSIGKRYVILWGVPSNEIYASENDKQINNPFVFMFGKGVGLKNNSRNPRDNKIITRISGYGSENNIPYGYPQIVWTGNQDWDYTINNDSTNPNSYPIYKGIVGGQYVKLIKHPFTRTHLMPTIYGETINKKVNPLASGYNPNIEIKDYYDATSDASYQYPNEINTQAPSYEIHEFDVKPELGSKSVTGAVPLDGNLQPTDHWDDSIDDDGNYIQSYFRISLPILDFDVYACASITQEMQINMRSGACIGCTFQIQVDWDDYKKNFYDSDGNFVPDGANRDYTKYPDSSTTPIDVVVAKDTNTFGIIMPNTYQRVLSGDEFVILGISLPLSYITNAETRLDNEMKSYMLENNVYYHEYPLKFDEYFLANNTYILNQIRPNCIVRFKYGDDNLELFVKQITIKYGEGVLPQYDITLTDNIEVTLNQIGQVADDVERLSTLISALRENYSRNVWNELSKKLSKVQDDTSQGKITSLKGFQVSADFVSGLLGEGGIFRKDADGKTYIETDRLYVRLKAYFDEIEVKKYTHSGGNRIASKTGIKTVKVEYYNANDEIVEDASQAAYYRCYFRLTDDDGNTITNDWVVGDLARSQEFKQGTNGYWRAVVGVGTTPDSDGLGYIDLSKGDCLQDSDVPQAQDDIIQLGNNDSEHHSDRQGAIIEYSTGANAPSYQIYQGINSYDLTGKNYVTLGYNSSTGKAELIVYGDAFIGNQNGSHIQYNSTTGELTIKATIDAQSTIGNQSLEEYIQEHQTTWTEQEIETLITDSTSEQFADIDTAIETLQNQADGAIETWFYNGVPTLNNEPASTWNTTELKDRHLGDLYYDNSTGYAYRFTKTGSTYSWNPISDSAVAKALSDAAAAQATANSKRRIFFVTPTPPYEQGDLWVNATYPANNTYTDAANNRYYNDVLRCKTTKASGSFSISDWTLASKYTDDSKFNSYIDQLLNHTIISNPSDAQQVANTYNSVMQALNQGTVIEGGLVLSTLIGLRDSNNTVWAGISGAYNASSIGNGIASWYGGAMVDIEGTMTRVSSPSGNPSAKNYYEYDSTNNIYIQSKDTSVVSGKTYYTRNWDSLSDAQKKTTSAYAKSLFRMDGTGYVASGNISWDSLGRVTLKNLYTDTGKSIDQLLALFSIGGTIPTNAYITPAYPFSSLEVLVDGSSVDVIEALQKLQQLFVAHYKEVNGVPTNELESIEATAPLWSQGEVSALGYDGSGGGGGGSVTVYDGLDSTNPNIALSANQGRVLKGLIDNKDLSAYALKSELATVATSGSYNDLSNKPTIPAAQIQSNWNQTTTTAKDYIKNKPTKVSAFTNDANYVTSSSLNTTLASYVTNSSLNTTLASYATQTWVTNKGYATTSAMNTELAKYLPLAGGTMSNTNLVTNLNADLLDGKHASELFTDLSNSGNNISLTIGGTTNTLRVAYADTSSAVGELKYIYFTKNDNSGYPMLLLVSDVSEWYSKTSTSSTTSKWFGMIGNLIAWRAGSMARNYNCRFVAAVSYYNAYYRLQSDNSWVEPMVVSYDSKYYLAIKLTSASQYCYFLGYTHNLLDTFIKLNYTSSTALPSGVEIIYEGGGIPYQATSITASSTITVEGLLTANGNIKTDSYIEIGDYRIVADTANTALKVVHKNGTTAVNFYATGENSALGVNTSGSGGGGMDIEAMWTQLGNSDASRKINYVHIQDALTNNGYATQSWVNQQGFLKSYTETDPVFTASAAHGITSANITSWNNKVSNVQADWNATSGLAVILNKPTNLVTTTSLSTALSDYLPLAGGTMSNTNVVTNLNADLLDGVHLSSLVRIYKQATYDLNELGNNAAVYRLDSSPTNAFPYAAYGNVLIVGNSSSDTCYQLGAAYNRDKLWFRTGSWNSDGTGTIRSKDWKEIAFTDSNVASATALETSRTLWGQDFNGSANVSGNMTGVGSIAASGDITVTRSGTTSATMRVVNENGAVSLLASVNRGVYDSETSKWVIGTNGTNTFLMDGNVGINTTSPQQQLHIADKTYAYSSVGLSGVAMYFRKLSTNTTAFNHTLRFIRHDSENNTVEDIRILGVYSTDTYKHTYFNGTYNNSAMRIDGYGTDANVGIGIATAPSYKLHVDGDAYATKLYLNGSNFLGGNSTQLYAYIGTANPFVLGSNYVRRGTSDTDVTLGTSSYRWANLYSVLGNFSGQITSSVATGTSPLSVASTTLVDNLNADLLDGYHATEVSRLGWVGVNNATGSSDQCKWYEVNVPTSSGSLYVYDIIAHRNAYPFVAYYRLAIYRYNANVVSVSLINHGFNHRNANQTRVCVAIDSNQKVYIQSGSRTASNYLRIRPYYNSGGINTTAVGEAAFGTADGFTALKMVTDSGYFRVDTSAATQSTTYDGDPMIRTSVRIGNAYLWWDDTNNCLRITGVNSNGVPTASVVVNVNVSGEVTALKTS